MLLHLQTHSASLKNKLNIFTNLLNEDLRFIKLILYNVVS